MGYERESLYNVFNFFQGVGDSNLAPSKDPFLRSARFISYYFKGISSFMKFFSSLFYQVPISQGHKACPQYSETPTPPKENKDWFPRMKFDGQIYPVLMVWDLRCFCRCGVYRVGLHLHSGSRGSLLRSWQQLHSFPNPPPATTLWGFLQGGVRDFKFKIFLCLVFLI